MQEQIVREETVRREVIRQQAAAIMRAGSGRLAKAYQRPCFICHQTGACLHREPDVELALMGVR
jgi:hypothetical protein